MTMTKDVELPADFAAAVAYLRAEIAIARASVGDALAQMPRLEESRTRIHLLTVAIDLLGAPFK